jgi:predicted NAD-dependent protein-ADP-ribosyltransferase YbiA (DUF1768 family)
MAEEVAALMPLLEEAPLGNTIVETAIEELVAPTITLRRKKPVIQPAPEQYAEKPAADDKTLKEFYAKRGKKPQLYGYDGTGGLAVRTKDGTVENTIPLPKYRPLTVEFVADMEEKRRSAIDEAENKFEEAMDNLRAKIAEYVQGGSQSAVKDAQLGVEIADEARMRAQFANQATYKMESIRTNRIFYDDPTNVSALPYDVYRRAVGMHPLRSMYVKEMTAAEEADAEAEAEAEKEEATMDDGVTVDTGIKEATEQPRSNVLILFNRPDDNEYGFMSNEYPVEFNWKGVQYFMADQALSAEKARYFGDMAILQKIMKTRSATTMRSEARKLGSGPKSALQTEGQEAAAPVEGEGEATNVVQQQKAAQWTSMYPKILISVILAKFRQHLGLRRQLLGTGDAKIAFAEHRNTEEGIGLAITDARAGIEAKWRGKNMLGQSLMDVRTQLRGGAEEVTGAEASTITDATISAEAAAARQVGAIIGASKRKMPTLPPVATNF